MAGSVNKVILVGNLGADPEIRSTQDGKEIATFRIATSDTWRDKSSGERRERTEWHRVVAFSDGLVNVIKNYLRKGSKVYVEGGLQTRKWTDNAGQDRYTTEVVLQGYNSVLTMLDSKGGQSNSNQSGNFNAANQNPQNSNTHQQASGQDFQNEPIDDEIPF